MKFSALTVTDGSASVRYVEAGADGRIVIPDAQHMFSASFERAGQDLVLVNPGAPDIRVTGYFASPQPADLYSPEGAVLTASVVARLAGPIAPGQYARTGTETGDDPIGQVETLEGSVTVQHVDGTVETLSLGSKVFQGDVVQTEAGGGVSLTFVDGTIFTLASASRMVLDELIYDPNGTENSGLFNLVEGGFVFIAGQAAKTGGMEIQTPTSTMGIRGTTVKVEIVTSAGKSTVQVSLNRDPDGGIGRIELRDLDGNLLSTIDSTDSNWIVGADSTEPVQVERSASDLASDSVLISQAVSAYNAAAARVQQGQTLVEQGDGGSSEAGEGTGAGSDGPAPGATPTPTPTQPSPTGVGTAPDPGTTATGDPGAGSGAGSETGGGNGGGEQPAIQGSTGSVTDRNDDPVPAAITLTAPEDSAITGAVTATDADGDPLTYSVETGASHGAVVFLGDGTFTYTPNADFFGTDSFTFTVKDPEGGSATGTLNIVMTPVNDAVELSGGVTSGALSEDAADAVLEASGQIGFADVDLADAHVVGVTFDGTAPLGALTAEVTDAATGDGAGTLTWTYTVPNSAVQFLGIGETVVQTWTLEVSDGAGSVATEVVTLTLTGTNDAPVVSVAADGAPATLVEAGDGSETANGVAVATLEITDADGDAKYDTDAMLSDEQMAWTATDSEGGVVYTAQARFGEVTFDPTAGTLTYRLDEALADALDQGDLETESFTIPVIDEAGVTASVAVAFEIRGSNDAPVAVADIDDIALVSANTDLTGSVAYNDTDADADAALSYALVAPVAGLTLNADGSYVFDPTAPEYATLALNEQLTVVADYIVTDEHGASDQSTLTLSITGAYVAPVASSGSNYGVGEVLGIAFGGYYSSEGVMLSGFFDSNSDGTVDSATETAVLPMPEYYYSYGSSYGLAIGDLDGDGDGDVVFTTDYGIVVQTNLGDIDDDGIIDFSSTQLDTTYQFYSYDVALADLNGDGALDIVSAQYGNLYQWINAGDANQNGLVDEFTLQTAIQNVSGWNYGYGITTADMNGDGLIDVLSSGYNVTVISYNQGNANAEGIVEYDHVAISDPLSLYAMGVDTGDLDGDGDMDFVLSRWGFNNVVYFNQGNIGVDGLPVYATVELPTGGYTMESEIADIDGDGDLDIVSSDLYGVVRLGLNTGVTNGDGVVEFEVSTVASGATSSYGVSVGDVDADGDLDIVVPTAGGTAYILTNLGDNDGDSVPDFLSNPLAGSISSWDAEILFAAQSEPLSSYAIPADLFDDGSEVASIILGNGSALPGWLSFNATADRIDVLDSFDASDAGVYQLVAYTAEFEGQQQKAGLSIELSDTGAIEAVRIDTGPEADILDFGLSASIDLSALDSTMLDGVGTLDIENGVQDNLQLTLEDVLSIVGETGQDFTILSDAGDTISFADNSGWTVHGAGEPFDPVEGVRYVEVYDTPTDTGFGDVLATLAIGDSGELGQGAGLS